MVIGAGKVGFIVRESLVSVLGTGKPGVVPEASPLFIKKGRRETGFLNSKRGLFNFESIPHI